LYTSFLYIIPKSVRSILRGRSRRGNKAIADKNSYGNIEATCSNNDNNMDAVRKNIPYYCL
jgi:hypothetical protein